MSGGNNSALFFVEGSFSHQNPFILEALRREFPELTFSEFDMWADVLRSDFLWTLAAMIEAAADYPRSTLGKLQTPRIYATRTRIARRHFKRWLSRRSDGAAPLFSFQTQSIFDASGAGCPHFVYTDHMYLANRRYRDQSFMPEAPSHWVPRETRIFQNAAHCLTTSTFATRSLIEDYRVPSDRVTTIYCGANANRENGAQTRRPGTGRILFVGLEWERKGGPELLAAFRQVRERCPSAELWIAGPESVGSTPEGCCLFGRLPLAEVRALFDQCDIFCLPSRKEPSAVVLSEALAYAIPIVATDVGGSADRVEDGVNGILVEQGDTDALADALTQLCSQPERRASMGLASAELSAKHFTWQAVGLKMGEALRNTLGNSILTS